MASSWKSYPAKAFPWLRQFFEEGMDGRRGETAASMASFYQMPMTRDGWPTSRRSGNCNLRSLLCAKCCSSSLWLQCTWICCAPELPLFRSEKAVRSLETWRPACRLLRCFCADSSKLKILCPKGEAHRAGFKTTNYWPIGFQLS